MPPFPLVNCKSTRGLLGGESIGYGLLLQEMSDSGCIVQKWIRLAVNRSHWTSLGAVFA